MRVEPLTEGVPAGYQKTIRGKNVSQLDEQLLMLTPDPHLLEEELSLQN